jgi:hypothetical protein
MVRVHLRPERTGPAIWGKKEKVLWIICFLRPFAIIPLAKLFAAGYFECVNEPKCRALISLIEG